MKDCSKNSIAETRAKEASHAEQFAKFVEAQNELINSGTSLLSGNSDEEDYSQYLRLVKHVEHVWDSVLVLYREQLYPQAFFLSITCLEEIGKIGVCRFQIVLRMNERKQGRVITKTLDVSRRRNPFYSHRKKHLLAAGAGALINRRLDRILGVQLISQFLDDVEAGRIEVKRQSALYADLGETEPQLPMEIFSRENVEFYVLLAGELMAEVLGFAPSEFERLLEKVQKFEKEIGHVWE